jgi:hypothetical protein
MTRLVSPVFTGFTGTSTSFSQSVGLEPLKIAGANNLTVLSLLYESTLLHTVEASEVWSKSTCPGQDCEAQNPTYRTLGQSRDKAAGEGLGLTSFCGFRKSKPEMELCLVQ